MYKEETYSGKIIDLVNNRIFKGTISVVNGKISNIKEENVEENHYILPGLIDAHIHIESSMLIPSEFARLSVTHGTVATVSDPHEIANVLGTDGIKFMIENGKKVPFKFYFGAPSCVPATPFETSGAEIGIKDLDELLNMKDIKYLSEMMNWPGVLFDDKTVKEKLEIAKKHNKPIDGHAPGVKGKDAEKYAEAGISTDHECFTIEEAEDKIKYGMKILIREGSAAKNFNSLIPLIEKYPDKIMFCSDDRHPDDLVNNHINDHVKRSISLGYDPITVLKAATLNPVKHYNLDVGLLQKGDDADFIIVDDLNKFNVLSTYIKGEKVADKGKTLINSVEEESPNIFNIDSINMYDLKVKPESHTIKVIEAFDGQLITKSGLYPAKTSGDNIISDTEKDILKIVVINRYNEAKPGIGFISNFGLKEGAIASTVAHDSHNIVATGTSDKEIAQAICLLIRTRGGISLANGDVKKTLALPVAGLMSNEDGYKVAKEYNNINEEAKELGSELNSPYMTLSFMALLVIPDLKLSDKGLFDGKKFEFTPLFDQ